MNVLITAGPTREPIDPVRFISNHSSGKTGFALAHAFQIRGHRVVLIAGPNHQSVPAGVDYLPVETAQEMYDAVARHIGRAEIAIFTAAVADYTPAQVASQKMKKQEGGMTLELVRTRDILGSARSVMGFRGTLVGFAAETEQVVQNARLKLEKKGCDLVVANDVSKPGLGFESDRNEWVLVFQDREVPIAEASKIDLTELLAEEILQMMTNE